MHHRTQRAVQRRASSGVQQSAQRSPTPGVSEHLIPAVLCPAQHGVLQRTQAALHSHPQEELPTGAEGAVHHSGNYLCKLLSSPH